MTKGLVIAIGGPPKGGDKGGSSDIQDEERRNALRAFMSAVQNGDVEQGMKAWARMDACGPPAMADDSGDDGMDAGLSDNAPKGGKTSMYREEG